MISRGKTLVALDLANVYGQVKTARAESGTSGPVGGDYTKLKSVLVPEKDDCTLTCFAPISNPNEDVDAYSRTNNLHNMLRYCGYLVYTTERRNGKADVDVNLAVKSMEIMAKGQYECFVLVSADGDFEPLLVHMRESGIKVVVASISQYTSVRLKMHADELIDLNDWAAVAAEEQGQSRRMDDDEIFRRFETVSSAVYEMGKVMDDRSRRRVTFNTFISSMGRLVTVYSDAKMDVHRAVTETLKDCMESLTADCMEKEDIEFTILTMSQLKEASVSPGLVDDVKSRFYMKHVGDQ